ncbi:MAG: acylphosphatase [Candidatus Omnitrophica bacterium]|nr:acylphosphatase [Candidatus Omnitrophota bacterium]
MKQVHVYYCGRVQGVGFRFTAEIIANELGIKGWVKNLPDGRVEVLAQAEEGKLKDFLARIKDSFSSYISDVSLDWSLADNGFKGFSIG